MPIVKPNSASTGLGTSAARRIAKPVTRTTSNVRNTKEAELATPRDFGDGSNIRVVVRGRGRNERELKAKSSVVVDTSFESKTEISVRYGDDFSTNKTYTLDRVFGAEADQEMIFDEVVSPIVDDLISGMNCTVFAYGQTGTGKT
jgi:kinesin family protein 11